MKTKFLWLLPAVFLLSGCDSELEGKLNLNQELTVLETVRRDNGGFPGGRPGRDTQQELKLQPGQWDITITRESDRQVVFEVKDARNRTHKIVLKTPRETSLPERSGEFSLPGAQSGQPFDVQGVVDTVVTDSDLMRDNERCSYQRPYTVCGPDGRGRHHCWTEWRTVWGYRYVEFINRTTTQSLAGQITATGAVAGDFGGHRTDVERIYRYAEQCF